MVHTLVPTPKVVKRKTHGYLLVYVEAAALVNSLAYTQKQVEATRCRGRGTF